MNGNSELPPVSPALHHDLIDQGLVYIGDVSPAEVTDGIIEIRVPEENLALGPGKSTMLQTEKGVVALQPGTIIVVDTVDQQGTPIVVNTYIDENRYMKPLLDTATDSYGYSDYPQVVQDRVNAIFAVADGIFSDAAAQKPPTVDLRGDITEPETEAATATQYTSDHEWGVDYGYGFVPGPEPEPEPAYPRRKTQPDMPFTQAHRHALNTLLADQDRAAAETPSQQAVQNATNPGRAARRRSQESGGAARRLLDFAISAGNILLETISTNFAQNGRSTAEQTRTAAHRRTRHSHAVPTAPASRHARNGSTPTSAGHSPRHGRPQDQDRDLIDA